jgi:hypothetical protein
MKGTFNRGRVAVAVGLAFTVSVLLYLWTVDTTKAGLRLWGEKRDYYNLLTRGLRKGHLYMDAAPDPALLALPPSDRPGNAPFMLDASLYRDRYYLYFGIVPAALLYLPYYAATGQGFPEAGAAVVFASAGLIFSVLWWNEVRRRYFPSLGGVWAAGSVLALSIGSSVLSTLRRPLFYEVAISAGYAFMMLSLWAFLRARFAAGRGAAWLVLGAVAAGLAVGSRANLGPACLVLVLCGALGSARAHERGPASALILGGTAFGALLLLLAAYNVARFSDPLEFGHSYQLGVEPRQLFHLGNFLHNAAIYYLRPPALNGYFPFVAPAGEPVKPVDYVGRETAHGEFVWLPIALAVFFGLGLSARRWKQRRDVIWVLGVPLAVFAVNFVVTASAGVRANRYMLDFHPTLVLAVVASLGLWSSSAPRALRALAGAAMMAAVLFNLLGSLQAQGLFRATDPVAYSRVASVADRIVWPLLPSRPAVGDRLAKLRWPAQPRPGAAEPLCAAGSPGFDDIVWLEYASGNRARLAYQYSEFGRANGRWFSLNPGQQAVIALSGALLLPRADHPWYGDRPLAGQEILKRSLVVSVDGVRQFERDVPSHDSSPSLEQWGSWRHKDGVGYSFSGSHLEVSERPLEDSRVRRASESQGSFRVRLEFPAACAGRFEPILQSGNASRFDTLVLHFVRPGYVQLVHDQLGSGARWSPEFAVDYARPQHVEIELPFADGRVDWRADGPVLRTVPTDEIRVRWNGRTVFEPDVTPAPGTRLQVVLGANLLHSSVCEAMYEGLLEPEPADEPLGGVHPGDIVFKRTLSGAFESDCGLLTRFERDDGAECALCWERENAEGKVRLGWTENGATIWSRRSVSAEEVRELVEGISSDGTPVGDASQAAVSDRKGRLVVDAGHATMLAVRTDYFAKGVVHAVGAFVGKWSGSALSREEKTATPPVLVLPGRIRIAIQLQSGRKISSSPILEAGEIGAADSLYLRSLSDGRYVIGLDHWSVGTIESEPFDLGVGFVTTLGIEMSSLEPHASAGQGVLRVSVDGHVVLERSTPLYSVKAGEIFFGSNPLGMTTSARVFEGDLVAVRIRQGDWDLTGPHP